MKYHKFVLISFIILVLILPLSTTFGAETSGSFQKTTSQLESIVFSLKSLLNNLQKSLTGLPRSSFRAQVIPPTNGLVGHFKFDESSGTTASDSSGNGNNGTLINGSTWTTGKLGNAITFDGTDDYVNIGDTFYSDVLSVCAWVKAGVVDANPRSIIVKRNSSGVNTGANEWALTATTGGFNYTSWVSSSVASLNITGSVPVADNWYHVCGVQNGNGNTGYLYVNGTENASANQTAVMNNLTGPIQIGVRTNDNNNRYWNGIIDEVRIYNRALSTSEISDIYNSAGGNPTTDSRQTQSIPPATVSAPVISSFSASPSSITSGNSTTLSWSVSGATSLSINQGVGAVTGTSKSVAPTINTTYTLTATNASGVVTSSATVTVSTPAVTPPPSSLAPNPTGNGITIKDLSGTTQTNRPFTVSRVFKQGEIGNFPQARVNGAPVLTQADLKSRWPDNSVKHVLVSFLATVPANSSIAVDFVNQSSGNNNGAMTKAEMLAYDGGNWGGKIETSIGSADARAMLGDWNGTDTGLNGNGVRYWLKGPIVTQVIVEDKTPTLKYDFGSNSYKSLHPIFVLTFYPGTNLGVKIEYILENMWTTKLQDQSYSLELKTGNPASVSVYSKPTFNHIARTRWHKIFWSGQSPSGWIDPGHPGVVINYNFPYITSTQVLPNFDQSVVVEGVSTIINSFRTSTQKDIMGQGIWSSRGFGGIDDHSEATDVPLTYTKYLYTFHPELYAVLLGQADVAGHIPIHLRESAMEKFYDSAKTIDALGLPISISARPAARVFGDRAYLPASDQPIKVGPITTGGWDPQPSHQPSFTYIPYLITGEWYYGDELNFWAAFDLMYPIAGNRHNDWGFLNRIEIRGEGRALRELGFSSFISPDNSHEKSYFTEKLSNNIAILEGQYDIKDGSFYQPCTTNPFNEVTETSKWCWGRYSGFSAAGKANPLNFITIGAEATNNTLVSRGETEEFVDFTKERYAGKPWMINYKYTAMSILVELGYPIKKVRDAVMSNLLGQLRHPDYNPNLVPLYITPILRMPDGEYFDNWAAVKDAYLDKYKNLTTFSDNAYGVEAKAAASFLPSIEGATLSGQAAWNWIALKAPTRSLIYSNWAWLPRVIITSSDSTPPSTPTGLSASSISGMGAQLSWSSSTDNVGVLGYRIYRNGSQIAISGSPSYIDTSLVPSTTYNYTVAAYDTAGNVSKKSSSVSHTTSAFIKSNDSIPTTKLPVTIPTPPIKTPPPSSISSTTTTTPDQSSGKRRNSKRSSGSSPSVTTPTANTTSAKNDCTPLTIPRNVAFGSKGGDVTTLQNFLVTKGFTTPDNVTGYYGLVTESAVKAFQRQYAILSSGDPISTGYGVVGSMTRAKIHDLTVACTTTKTSTAETPQTVTPVEHTSTTQIPFVRGLALGTRGDDVTMLQNLLIAQGFLTADNVTGYYGYATQAAVQGFQRKFNIVSSGTPDTTGYGAVGPATRAKLNIFLGNTASLNKNATQIEILQKQVEMLLKLLADLQKESP